MKQNHTRTSTTVRCTERIFAIGVVCALALAPTFAFGEGEGEGGPRDKVAIVTAGAFTGDEFIGTLPIMQGSGVIQLHRGLPILRPSLFLEGELWEVQNLVSILNGVVQAEVMPLDAEWQRVRLVFPDSVMLGFDRTAVQSSDVVVGLWMPQPVSYASPQLTWGGRATTILPIEERLALPIPAMVAAGALNGAPLVVESHGFLGNNSLIAGVNQDFLFLVQRRASLP